MALRYPGTWLQQLQVKFYITISQSSFIILTGPNNPDDTSGEFFVK